MIQVALALIMIAAVLNEVLGVGKASRKSKAAYRLERQAYQYAAASRRYAKVPPMIKVIDQEKRWKKARRSALAAVSWALLADNFNRDEIAGAAVKVLHKDKALVFDQDALYKECLAALKSATCQ